MGAEHERKFLVADDGWRSHAVSSKELRQGYIAITELVEVRARIEGESGILTIKSRQMGVTRAEVNAPLAVFEARQLLDEFAETEVVKTRYLLDLTPHEWTIDVFHGRHSGLILLEIEGTIDVANIAVPAWVGREVTLLKEFRNSYLASHSYSDVLKQTGVHGDS